MPSLITVFLLMPLSWSLTFATVSLLVWILLLCLGGVPMNLSLAVKPRSLRLWQKLEILWSQPFVMDAAAFGSSDWSLNLWLRHPIPETKNWKLWVFLGTTQQLPSDKAFRGGSNVGSVRPGPWLIKPNYKTKTSSAGPITRMNATDH